MSVQRAIAVDYGMVTPANPARVIVPVIPTHAGNSNVLKVRSKLSTFDFNKDSPAT